MSELLEYEKNEINKMNFESYYYGEKSYKHLNPEKYTLEDGMYHIIENNHIQFRYQIKENLGKGAYGSVAKVIDHKDLETRAIKIIKKNSRYRPSYNVEITNLLYLSSKLLDNSNIYRDLIPIIQDYFVFRGHNMIVYNCYSKNLYETIIKKRILLSFDKLKIIFRDLVNTLVYLKKYKIIHADIKPENILFRNENSWNIILIDYGLSIKDYNNSNYNIQSMWYRSPEIIFRIPFDFRIDLWSLGCVIFELYYGMAAFRGKKETTIIEEMYKRIGSPSREFIEYINMNQNETDINECVNFKLVYNTLKEKYGRILNNITPLTNSDCDKNLIDIITRIFIYNPNRRITYEQILSHNFFLC